MDNNQIKLFVATYIKEPSLESNPRLALELDAFIHALTVQSEKHGVQLTPEKVKQAWANWKQERFEYVAHVQTYATENKQRLVTLTSNRLKATEPDLAKSPRLADTAKNFIQTYAQRLEHLSKEPLPEHIDTAWKDWKKGIQF